MLFLKLHEALVCVIESYIAQSVDVALGRLVVQHAAVDDQAAKRHLGILISQLGSDVIDACRQLRDYLLRHGC